MLDLKKVCADPLNLKIISFFNEHPITIDTCAGIATWLNQDSRQLQQALDYLVARDILTVHCTGSTAAYAYTQHKQLTEQIKKFLEEGKGYV